MPPAPVTAIVLARSAGAAADRAIAAALAHAAETVAVVSSAQAAARLAADWPAAIVTHAPFRNAAEALGRARPVHPVRFWFWAEEDPDVRAWSDVLRFAASDDPATCAFALADRCGRATIPVDPVLRPRVRLWRGDALPLRIDAAGRAVAVPGARQRVSAGRIVHHGYGSVTELVARSDYEIGCAVHAAIGLSGPSPLPAVTAGRLMRSWLAAWLATGMRHPTARLVKTFEHRVWLPLYLNARLREAAEEVAHAGREAWLAGHARFGGEAP